ncbi:MAG: outer membrane lipoprotein-sorting protein [Deltaproteobacteria bacterium]|nr:outer membrane lipoprotein-sorting protein [Deltaproteobacteria bacterium]
MFTLIPLLIPLLASAQSGPEWLARVDAAATPAQDAHVVLSVSLTDDRGRTAERTLEIWQKGEHLRLVRLTDPPRLAGVGLLVDAEDAVHLYLPAYERTRRVVGDQRSGAFMGTDISMEDLARTTFSRDYRAAVLSEDEATVRLALTPLDPSAHDYASSVLTVQRADALWTGLEHLDAEGAPMRRVELSDYRVVDGYAFAHKMTVTDLKKGRTSVATASSLSFDAGLSDELFTTTNLSRP